MSNTNSLFNKYSRYVAGGTTETANGKLEWWEKNVMSSDSSDISYAVEDFYVGRLDLIASVFYNEPRYWWVIAQYNNILDPFSEITGGRILMIPSSDRLNFMLASKQGGIPSTKIPINIISPVIT
jgi:hypothetical protein